MNPRDLKTTILGIVAGLVMMAGILWPDKIDPDTQAVVNTAIGQVVSGVGALIAVITGLIAKD